MSRPTILLIEDSTDSREILSILLADEFDCKAVPSRDEALKLLKTGYTPACIVSDYSMPGMTMDEFFDHLQPRKLKFVLLSAHADTEEVGQKFGVKRILRKPADPHALIRLIHQALGSGEHPAV